MSTHRADHPPTCRACGGTGWQAGPPIPYQAGGDAGAYSTVQPCTHHWSADDPADDEPRTRHGRPWPRLYWPDEPDPADIEDAKGQQQSEGELEYDARCDHDWYEDVDHNGLLDDDRHRTHLENP